MGHARGSHTATLLTDGRVLIAGGNDDSGVQASAELFDPATGTFSPTGSMTLSRHGHTATRLSDGRVLIAGGLSAHGTTAVYFASAELYDPATGKFSPTGLMADAHYGHTSTLLADGRVLIAGGQRDLAELYDPATGKFSTTGSMTVYREDNTATLLPDGRVLVTGGDNLSSDALASAELYDPATGKFSPTGSMSIARAVHSATLLPTGLVLIAGGWTNPSVTGTLASAELYDPATGKFSPTGSMAQVRYQASATLLSDGRVLVAGGADSSVKSLATAEAYDSATGKFSAAGSMTVAVYDHTATLLSDGSVLIAGGEGYSGVVASAELWRP
jgi:hypothetical protein